MNISFLLNGFKTLFYSFKKKEVDKIIENNNRSKKKVTIFLLHGSLLNYYNSFYPMLKYFFGYKVISVDYNFRGDACLESEKIASVIKKYKGKKVIVGHSYGGLLGRYVIAKYLKDGKDYHIITVAALNSGADINHVNLFDRWLYNVLGLMQPELKGSKVIKFLDKNPLKKAKITNIIGGKDSLVPEKSACINGKKPDIVLANENHLSIIYSKSLFYVLRGIIKNINK